MELVVPISRDAASRSMAALATTKNDNRQDTLTTTFEDHAVYLGPPRLSQLHSQTHAMADTDIRTSTGNVPAGRRATRRPKSIFTEPPVVGRLRGYTTKNMHWCLPRQHSQCGVPSLCGMAGGKFLQSNPITASYRLTIAKMVLGIGHSILPYSDVSP